MLINMDVRATELPHGCRPTHSPQRDLTWLRRGYTVVLHCTCRRAVRVDYIPKLREQAVTTPNQRLILFLMI